APLQRCHAVGGEPDAYRLDLGHRFETEDDGDDRGLLSDRIRKALTDEIATGTMAAGAALDEQQLADRFGASSTPVREALRQLAAGGLVEL
ncbi:GntR family transcriptional regulator, partial [Rhizobium ruizarguesonis]